MRKIIISESEKQNILKQHKKKLNEDDIFKTFQDSINAKINNIFGSSKTQDKPQTDDDQTDDDVSSDTVDDKSSDTSETSGTKTNFETTTEFVIDNFEGGYWNGSTPENEKTSKLGICQNHPKGSMGKSTETMFGLDRYNGNIESKPDGKRFFEIIDSEKKLLGMDKYCKTWKWGYRGGGKENELKKLAVQIMKTAYERNLKNYVKSEKTKNKIETIPGLTLHMSYASWNGPGYFQKFAKDLINAVDQGKSDKELIDVALKSRTDDRRTNKPKVLAAITNLKNKM